MSNKRRHELSETHSRQSKKYITETMVNENDPRVMNQIFGMY